MNPKTVFDEINKEISKKGISSVLGTLLGEGENMKCYEVIGFSNHVIKLTKGNNSKSIEDRRLRTYIYTTYIPINAISPTYQVKSISGLQYYEIQERIKETIFDRIHFLLRNGKLSSVIHLVKIVHEYEKSILWKNGVFLLDTKSYLKNFSINGRHLILIDHDGLTNNIEFVNLFHEGPWKLYRFQGTLDNLYKLKISRKVLENFAEWYFKFYFDFYSKHNIQHYFNNV